MTAPSAVDMGLVRGGNAVAQSNTVLSGQWHEERQTTRTPLAVTVVSDSRLLSDALPGLLAPHLDAQPLNTCTGGSLLSDVPPNPAGHVIVIDVGVGIQAVVNWSRYARRLQPPAHVIAIEVREDTETILTYIEAGIGGYTLQGATAAEVAEAIRWVRQGIANCTPRVAAELFARFATISSPPAPLTARELEVLRCINQDFSNQEIAAALVIEVRTVKHHVHSILHKLKLNHRWEAARMAVERGWLGASTRAQ
jgi:DNA-binding NarL/FixJ family response regulator